MPGRVSGCNRVIFSQVNKNLSPLYRNNSTPTDEGVSCFGALVPVHNPDEPEPKRACPEITNYNDQNYKHL